MIKVEVTTDKDVVNKLLADGWYLVDAIIHKSEYLFLLALAEDLRIELFKTLSINYPKK